MVFGIMAFGASAAQATPGAKWLILHEGALHEPSNANPAQIEGSIENNTASLLTKISGSAVKILCTAGNLENAFLVSNGTVKEGARVTFTGCKIYIKEIENPSCVPHSPGTAAGTVRTEAGHALLVLHEPSAGVHEDFTKILPDNAESKFGTVEVGELCPLPEKIPIFGVLYVKDCENAALTHLEKHLITQAPLTHLYALTDTAEHAANIDGSALIFPVGLYLHDLWSGDWA
jgi:hypothetical protein